jgi:Amt family ammonium transporter
MIVRLHRFRRTLSPLLVTLWLSAGMMPTLVWADDPSPVQVAQAAPAPAPASAAKGPAPVPITDADLKAVAGPKPDDLAKGDPGGALTGSVNDIVVSDSKKGLTLADLVNMVGQNRIAINFVWTLVT